MVRLTPLSSGMRVEWIESKDEIRARRADKKLATQIPVSVERILQDFPPGEPGYVSLEGIDVSIVQAQLAIRQWLREGRCHVSR